MQSKNIFVDTATVAFWKQLPYNGDSSLVCLDDVRQLFAGERIFQQLAKENVL